MFDNTFAVLFNKVGIYVVIFFAIDSALAELKNCCPVSASIFFENISRFFTISC